MDRNGIGGIGWKGADALPIWTSGQVNSIDFSTPVRYNFRVRIVALANGPTPLGLFYSLPTTRRSSRPGGATVAQSTCNRQVRGSTPLWGSRRSSPETLKSLAVYAAEGRGWYHRPSGGVGEWLKPPDCKSGVRKGFVGSNPTPSTIGDEQRPRNQIDRRLPRQRAQIAQR